MAQLDQASRGLTPLHLAVLANDYAKVSKIAKDREHGIEAGTTTGTTACMLAALYGRTDIFLFLTLKKASPHKKDSQGNNALDYVKQELPFVKDLIQEYKKFSASKPDQTGRRLIYGVLKAHQRDCKMAYAQGRADARAEAQTQAQAETQTETQAQAQLQTVMDVDQPDSPQAVQDPSVRLVFLRSINGKQQEIGEFKQIATAEHGYIGRKCTGFIHAADENDSPKFAVSGWGRAEDKKVVARNVLNNEDYTELVMQTAELLDFELEGNRFDPIYPGTESAKKGVYVACHAEKQLAVCALIKAISYVFDTKSLTIQNITGLKNQLDKLPPVLRENVIHLDHKLVCRSCVLFLELLTQKTGLGFRCQYQDWYVYGQRPQLRRLPNGDYTQVTEATSHSGLNNRAHVIKEDDEIGVLDTDGNMKTDLQSVSVEQDTDGLSIRGDWVTLSTPSTHRPSLKRPLVLRVPSDYAKRGSPVFEEPKYDGSRYPTFDLTPPSKEAQALQNLHSHTRMNDAPRITISPSPSGDSSAFGLHTDGLSPVMSQEYEVEEILQFKEENGVREFLVKWKDYPQDTWEPERNLTNASAAIAKFWEELNASQSRNQDAEEAIVVL